MKEYKFRGKRVDNGEWVYGFLVTSVNDRAYIIVYSTEDAVSTRNELDFIYAEVIPETVGQYTELDDLNKKPIYEDDVVRAWSQGTMATGKVERRVDGLWIMFPAYQNKQFWGLCPNHCGETSVEVIGNIHDGVTE